MNRSRVAVASAGLIVFTQPFEPAQGHQDQTWEGMQFTAFTFSMDSTPATTASGGAKQ